MKDVTAATAKGACIQLGRGVIDFPAFFRACSRPSTRACSRSSTRSTSPIRCPVFVNASAIRRARWRRLPDPQSTCGQGPRARQCPEVWSDARLPACHCREWPRPRTHSTPLLRIAIHEVRRRIPCRPPSSRSKCAGPGSMNLLPWPKRVERLPGEYVLTTPKPKTEITLKTGMEGYTLEVGRSGISIVAGNEAGAFYARQTLSQVIAGNRLAAGANFG